MQNKHAQFVAYRRKLPREMRSAAGGNSLRPRSRFERALALQLLAALAVIAAAFLDPLQSAIAVTGFVGVVLVDAGVHSRLACGFLGVLRIDSRREYGGSGRR